MISAPKSSALNHTWFEEQTKVLDLWTNSQINLSINQFTKLNSQIMLIWFLDLIHWHHDQGTGGKDLQWVTIKSFRLVCELNQMIHLKRYDSKEKFGHESVSSLKNFCELSFQVHFSHKSIIWFQKKNESNGLFYDSFFLIHFHYIEKHSQDILPKTICVPLNKDRHTGLEYHEVMNMVTQFSFLYELSL